MTDDEKILEEAIDWMESLTPEQLELEALKSQKSFRQKFCLYLDDERFPKTDYPWTIVRTVDEFRNAIRERGLPDLVSFDHDLGEEDGAETGVHAVKFLVEQTRELEEDPHIIEVNYHTANPVGRDNMKALWNSWLKFYSKYGGQDDS